MIIDLKRRGEREKVLECVKGLKEIMKMWKREKHVYNEIY